MKIESNLPQPPKRRRATDLELLLRALGMGILALVVAGVIYVFVQPALRVPVGFLIAMLVGLCLFVAGVLCVELYRTSPLAKRERGNTK